MTAGRYWPSGSVGSLLRRQRSSELGLTDAAVTESRHLFSCPKMARLLGFVLAFGSDKPSEISERHGGWSGHEPKAARYEGDRNRNSHGCTRESELKHPGGGAGGRGGGAGPPGGGGGAPARGGL